MTISLIESPLPLEPQPTVPPSTLGTRMRELLTAPITTGPIGRIGEAAITIATAYAIDHSPIDDATGGYGADVVGTAAGISFLTLFFRKGDPKLIPVGTVLALNTAVEQTQKYHLLENLPFLDKLDGAYDVRDFAAFGLGTLLYLGVDRVKQIIRQRRHDASIRNS